MNFRVGQVESRSVYLLNLPVHGHGESSARLGFPGELDDFLHALSKFGVLHQQREVRPSFLQEEHCEFTIMPNLSFMHTPADAHVSGYNNPASFFRQFGQPNVVGCARQEFFSQGYRFVIRFE